MIEPIINKSNVIVREPMVYIDGVCCKTKKEQQYYKIFSTISIICGVIGTLGFIAIISYFLG